MKFTSIMMTAAFVLSLIPSSMLLVKMLRTDWNRPDNPGGRAMVALLSVTVGSTLLSVIVLLLPDWAKGTYGAWIRIVIRFAVAAVIWNLVRLFNRAQREARRDYEMKD